MWIGRLDHVVAQVDLVEDHIQSAFCLLLSQGKCFLPRCRTIYLPQNEERNKHLVRNSLSAHLPCKPGAGHVSIRGLHSHTHFEPVQPQQD